MKQLKSLEDETHIYVLRPQPALTQILIDKKRKGWQRPYKYHK